MSLVSITNLKANSHISIFILNLSPLSTRPMYIHLPKRYFSLLTRHSKINSKLFSTSPLPSTFHNALLKKALTSIPHPSKKLDNHPRHTPLVLHTKLVTKSHHISIISLSYPFYISAVSISVLDLISTNISPSKMQMLSVSIPPMFCNLYYCFSSWSKVVSETF